MPERQEGVTSGEKLRERAVASEATLAMPGTEGYAWLGFSPSLRSPLPRRTTTSMSLPATPLRRGLRIVVTDDDPKLLTAIVQILSDAGHNVFAAYDGLSACEL